MERYGDLERTVHKRHGRRIVIGTGVKENGGFKLVTRGICEEFLRRLESMGDGAVTKLGPNVGQPTVDPEAASYLWMT